MDVVAALDGELGGCFVAAEERLDLNFVPGFYGVAVDGDDLVGGAKTGLVGGGFGFYGADERGCFGAVA